MFGSDNNPHKNSDRTTWSTVVTIITMLLLLHVLATFKYSLLVCWPSLYSSHANTTYHLTLDSDYDIGTFNHKSICHIEWHVRESTISVILRMRQLLLLTVAMSAHKVISHPSSSLAQLCTSQKGTLGIFTSQCSNGQAKENAWLIAFTVDHFLAHLLWILFFSQSLSVLSQYVWFGFNFCAQW